MASLASLPPILFYGPQTPVLGGNDGLGGGSQAGGVTPYRASLSGLQGVTPAPTPSPLLDPIPLPDAAKVLKAAALGGGSSGGGRSGTGNNTGGGGGSVTGGKSAGTVPGRL